ncbi:MAG: hypothetical protein AMXMBFR16_10550 [Candidatus Uhrbacteria bacterium]
MTNDDIRSYMREAYNLADRESTDTSTKVGAFLILKNGPITMGVNKFVAGYGDSPEHHERPLKYKITEHAERAAVYAAARLGYPTGGSTLICPWAACTDCARALILAGVVEVISHAQALQQTPERWREELQIAKRMFAAAGVRYTWWAGDVGDCQNLFNGAYWKP